MDANDLLINGNFKYISKPENGRRLLLAFTARTPGGRFKWLNHYASTDCDVLAINCFRVASVSDDLDTLLNIIDELEVEIQCIIKHLRPTETYAIGHSLAAFPAIVVGAKVGSRRVIAMSPETLIGMPFSRSAKRLKGTPTTYRTPDLKSYLINYPIEDLHVFAGELDMVDMFAASRLFGLPGVTLHALPNVGHGTITSLISGGDLTRILLNLNVRQFPFPADDTYFRNGAVQSWFRAVSVMGRRPRHAEKQLRSVLKEHPSNAALLRHLAKALLAQGRLGASHSAINKAARLAPGRPDIETLQRHIASLATS